MSEQAAREQLITASKGVTLLSKGITLLSEGVTLLSEGVTLLSEGATLLSKGVTLLSKDVTLLSKGVTLLSKGTSREPVGEIVLLCKEIVSKSRLSQETIPCTLAAENGIEVRAEGAVDIKALRSGGGRELSETVKEGARGGKPQLGTRPDGVPVPCGA